MCLISLILHIADTMDMECGPLDKSLLTMQDEHISSVIWQGGKRDKIDVRQLTTMHWQWDLTKHQIDLLELWGFRAFAYPQSIPQNDIRLITALIERWRPETNTFHFPFGELTITLEDVYMILGLPVYGRPVTHTELNNPKPYWMKKWKDLRLTKEKDRERLYDNGVILHRLRDRYKKIPKTKRPEYKEQDAIVYTRAYLLYIIGGVLFPTGKRDVVHPRYLQLIQDTDQIVGYAWGAAVLGYLFRGLTKAAHKSAMAFNGCSMLLMYWAWERLLPGAPEIAPHQDFTHPRALAWIEARRRVNPHHHTGLYRGDFDSFEMCWLTWRPYERFYDRIDVDDESHDSEMLDALHISLGRLPLVAFEIIEYVMPDRVMRQFGMLQHIPQDPVDMSQLRRERLSRWERDDHIRNLSHIRDQWDSFMDTGLPVIEEVADVSIEDYMDWFRRVSKLRIAPFLAEHPTEIVPRDWYPQQDMVEAVCF